MLKKRLFEDLLDEVKEEKGYKIDTDLTAEDLKDLVVKFKALYKKEKGEDFPSNPKEQLIEAVTAVFRSWNNPRAIVYRRLNDIPENGVQQLTFKRWYLEIREKLQEQELLFQETQLMGIMNYMVSI